MYSDLSFNYSANIQRLAIGSEQQPVVIVDNLLDDPEKLLDYAEQGDKFKSISSDYYPGIRKSIEGAYPFYICDFIRDFFSQPMSLSEYSKANVSLCALSLATTKASKLRPIQSLPHFDSADEMQFAVVHYLCSSDCGGTSFYKHRKTGYESITVSRIKTYATILKDQVLSNRFQGKRYMDGDNEWFERIATVEAKFNRAVFYRGNSIHSGNIKPGNDLSNNPRIGRLTANTFVNFTIQ